MASTCTRDPQLLASCSGPSRSRHIQTPGRRVTGKFKKQSNFSLSLTASNSSQTLSRRAMACPILPHPMMPTVELLH
eukprot:684168-Hanusia_phi.AAC.1